MRIAILETGRPPSALAERFGDYPSMMARMLGGGFNIDRFDVAAGELPADPSDYEAYLVTGSPAGVYDPLPWIEPLKDFLRSAHDQKLVGICFGHQVMAEAFGGHVEKLDKGWGIGLQHYEVDRVEPWMGEVAAIDVPASHQDQVVAQPPNTEVVASSAFTPFAALAWTDRPAISVQFHPEFEPEYAKALIESRREKMPDADGAIASLDQPNDNARIADWIRRFLIAPKEN
jgi:GMP synthase-like glutamine amidotransferase